MDELKNELNKFEAKYDKSKRFDFSKVFTFDTETESSKTDLSKNWIHLYAVGIYSPNFNNGEPYVMIKKDTPNDEFIKFVFDALPNKSIIFVHNLNFDGRFILDYCEHNNIKYKIRLLKGKIIRIIVIFKRNNKKIKLIFRDSFVLLLSSLENLTNGFEVQHKKLKLDYEIGIDDPRFKDYFTNDLIGLYEVLEKANDYGLLQKATLAANVMALYKYENPNIKFERCDENIDAIFRKSYYGGRTEVFKHLFESKNDKDVLYYYDFNSLYPYVMYKYEYPLPIANNYENVDKYDPNKLSISYVYVKTPPNLKIPVLPYRTKEGKLIFPTGEFYGFYTSSEINLALRLGYTIDFIHIYQFKKTDYIFKNWVEKHYQEKMNAPNKTIKTIAKLRLNSLYGKFGQRMELKDLKEITEEEAINDTEHIKYKIGSHYYIVIDKKDIYSDFIHSEIASFITANARVELYEMMLRAGLDNIYYCDTDSILTSTKLPDEYVDDKILGKMKLEHIVKNYVAIAPKLYAITDGVENKEIVRAKGVPMNLLSDEDRLKYRYEVMKEAFLTGDLNKLSVTFSTYLSFKQRRIRHKDSFATNAITTKKIKQIDTKRVIIEPYTENYDTRPLNVRKVSDGIITNEVIIE